MKIGNGNRLKISNRNTIDRNTGNKKQIEIQVIKIGNGKQIENK